MTDQYKNISSSYQEARKSPSTLFLEAPSFIKAVGDVSNKKIIDFACGEGYYTRILKNLGANSVTGLDLSPEMIDLAIAQEQQKPLGIKYLVADASKSKIIGQFDIATAVFLFNYAEDIETLKNMLMNVSQNLKSDGRLVSIVPNPNFVNGRGDTKPYGYVLEAVAKSSTSIKSKMTFIGDESFSILFTQWSQYIYESILSDLGFREVHWSHFTVSEDGINKYGNEFWITTLNNPKSIILSAIKI